MMTASGCVAPTVRDSTERDSNAAAAPLPEPILAEREFVVETGPASPPADYAFYLPRNATLNALLRWQSGQTQFLLEIFQDNNRVYYAIAEEPTTLRVRQELGPGDYFIRISLYSFSAVSERYTLEISFEEPKLNDRVFVAHDETEAFERIRRAMTGVPCDAPVSMAETTANLQRLALHTFDDGPGPREMAISGNLLLAARMDGFTAVDISDPGDPQVLEHYGGTLGVTRDVKFSPDNQTAIMASHDAIDLVDIRDPTNPVRTGRWTFADAPMPQSFAVGNMHMVFPARIAEEDWVFLATQSSTGVWVLRLDGPPESRNLTFVTSIMPVSGLDAAPHDIFVEFDVDRLQWLLYSSEFREGWAVYDVSTPAEPKVVAIVPNSDGTSTHSAQPGKVGQRRLVATTTEGGIDLLKVYDATVLERPVMIGYWTRKVGPEILEAQHNIQIVGNRLYLAHYQNGLFVFDLSALPTTGAVELEPIAHYMGSHEARLGTEIGFWDILLQDGVVYAGVHAGDFEVGLHVIGFGCIRAGDVAQRSRG